ncbi:uncharacterized protein TRAVEDRAFT_41223 [Trametes versicolor FP-101664 SS1]|uniref:uncharacterized protein n=1 Tax=Trametes versicolor (strain FP-101664) TaxID=717944 RepID=UPI000462246C|nr:uncharacterized protein TRAVEDRAFT_41223 [Trametes versicolor FP-101664 SS1]EIW63795.1 hypothetical protein TRAVEDRAFT_41223 [Trametes versicolor FP-101664 SS1]
MKFIHSLAVLSLLALGVQSAPHTKRDGASSQATLDVAGMPVVELSSTGSAAIATATATVTVPHIRRKSSGSHSHGLGLGPGAHVPAHSNHATPGLSISKTLAASALTIVGSITIGAVAVL